MVSTQPGGCSCLTSRSFEGLSLSMRSYFGVFQQGVFTKGENLKAQHLALKGCNHQLADLLLPPSRARARVSELFGALENSSVSQGCSGELVGSSRCRSTCCCTRCTKSGWCRMFSRRKRRRARSFSFCKQRRGIRQGRRARRLTFGSREPCGGWGVFHQERGGDQKALVLG